MGPDDVNVNESVPDQGSEGQEPSLRETLEQQFEAAESPAAPAPPAGGETRERDPQTGRFVPKGPAQAPGEPEAPISHPGTGQPPPQQQTAPQAPVPGAQATEPLKAPASWRPEVREKWAGMPPEVQAEVHRREREFQQVLQHAAGARQVADALERTVAPYQLLIAAEQSDPIRAIGALFRHAAVLKTGSPVDKVQLVANLIAQHGVDLQMLDQYLAGNGIPQQMAQAQQQFRDPRVDQMLAQQQLMEQQQKEATNRELSQGIEWFAQQPQYEFFQDVRTTMADLIEMYGRRGEVLPMAEAYKRACAMDPSVSKIMADRATAASSVRLGQAALRARRAASSVKGDSTPHGATVPKDDSVRAALEAAFEEHGA